MPREHRAPLAMDDRKHRGHLTRRQGGLVHMAREAFLEDHYSRRGFREMMRALRHGITTRGMSPRERAAVDEAHRAIGGRSGRRWEYAYRHAQG